MPHQPHFFYLFVTNLWPMPVAHIFYLFFYQFMANACHPHFLFLFQQSMANACLIPTTPQYHCPHPYLPTWGSLTLHAPGGFLTQPAPSATPCIATAWAQLSHPSLNSRVINLVCWTCLQQVKKMFCLSVSNGIIGLTYVLNLIQ